MSLRMRTPFAVLLASLIEVVLPHQNQAAVIVAENLLVNISASDATAGTAQWANSGTLGGAFAEVGDVTIGNFGPNNNIGASFTDAALNAYTGDNGANSILSTPGIEGAGTRSFEVWAFNPAVADEETIVSWSRRGGPDGTHVSFGYGSNGIWGAVTHWGAPDISWNGTPPVGEWHHLVYTWDGVRTRLYEDGMLKHLEASTPINDNPVLNSHQGFPINLGAQNEGTAPGTLATGAGLRLSGAIGKVRIHDGVLSASAVLNNFHEDAASYGQTQLYPVSLPPVAQPLSSGPKHRYSFTSDASDSVGGAHGTVSDAGTITNAVFSGGQLDLSANAGQASNFITEDAYVNLPNGIISALGAGGQATIEAWFTVTQNRTWARVFDFGKSDGAEGTSGGAPNSNYMMFTPRSSDRGARLLIRSNDSVGGGFGETVNDQTTPTNDGMPTGVQHHMVAVFDETTDLQKLYINGVEAEVGTLPLRPSFTLSTLQDINNFLGRAQWPDPLFDGKFNEFRIYDYALSGNQVLGNFQLGPDIVNIQELAGDFNDNGTVDAADYVAWRKNTGNNPLPNDTGLATQTARFNLWRANFGNMAGSGSFATGAVPEPAALVILLTGALALFSRRRAVVS